MQPSPSQRLRVQTETVPHAVVLFPEGEVDMESYDTFRQALASATAVGSPNIVVDLAHVRYIDSMGLGALVSALRDANEAGYHMCLVSESPHLSRLLDVTGLSQLFQVYRHREDALEDAVLQESSPPSAGEE